MKLIKRSAKLLLFFFYFVTLAAVSSKLFFEENFDFILKRLTQNDTQLGEEILRIGLSEAHTSFSPLANDTGSRSRLLNIYEGLVRVNSELSVEPALAISYGSVDPVTWEFHLRKGVKFHDGTDLKVRDVMSSIRQAKELPSSGVKDLASTIKETAAAGDDILRIVTNSPDPLLPQKLTSLFIFKEGDESVGTGPYVILKKEDTALHLAPFDGYWGEYPIFDRVIIRTFKSREDKIAALEKGSVDIITNVPPDAALNFEYENYRLISLPSLEVNFLLFNMKEFFSDQRLREAVLLGLPVKTLASLTQGFVTPTDQFVGRGIFGFDPSIKRPRYNPERAVDLINAMATERGVLPPFSVALDLPIGLETFGSKIKSYLSKIGISVEVRFISEDALSTKVESGTSPFFLFGWRSDLGDASDFLSAVAHSKKGSFGNYNGGNYANAEVDALIEKSQNIVKPLERLEIVRQIMKKITLEDIIGVPLFSPDVLYAVSKRVRFQPRVDGYVLASEVTL